MKDRSMFGSLREFLEEDHFKDHQELEIFLPSEKRTYRIVGAAKHNNDYLFDAYDLFTKEGVKRYLDDMQAEAKNGGQVDQNSVWDTPLITLSTCSGTDGTVRMLVHAVLVKVER